MYTQTEYTMVYYPKISVQLYWFRDTLGLFKKMAEDKYAIGLSIVHVILYYSMCNEPS